MSFLLGTDEETLDATVGRTAGFSLLEKDAQPGFTEGAANAAGMGVYRGISRGASVAANVATPVLRPVAQKIDEIFGTSADQYLLDEQAKANRSLIESKIDGQTTGLAGQLLYGIGDVLTTVASTGGNPFAAGGLYGTTQAGIGIMDEGLDTTTAIMKGAVEGVGMGVGVALPAALAGSLAYRLGTGAALNVAQGVATRAGVATVLNTRGYEDMAKQYEAFGVTDMLIDGVLGATFGGFMGKVKPSDVDAALVRQSQAHTELGTAPGIPVDTVSRNAHVKAVDMAREQMLRGEDVEVSRVADRATFAREDMPPEMAAAVREVESVPELARAVRELEETQEMARARGLVVDDAPLYSRAQDVFATGKIDEITGLPLNSDGTVTVYHHTSKANADAINKSGMLKAAGEPDVYVTTRKETDTGYGETAVPIRVKPDKLQIDDEFPDGRVDYRIDAKRPGGSVKVSVGEASPKYSRAQEETPEFKQWFGDSKVVDADGKPLVVYHGTRSDFSVFEHGKGIKTDHGLSGKGFYFTPNKDLAGAYTRFEDNGNVMPVFLNLKNPYKFSGSASIELFNELGGGRRPVDMFGEEGKAWSEAVTEGLKKLGYDGYLDATSARYATEIVAFDPTQIKSATGNNGNFDPTNPDIRMSRGDSSAKSTVPELTTRFRSEFGKDADRLTNYARVEFVQSVSDLPGGPHPSDVRGMFWQGRSYVVADNVPPDAIKGLILHEVGTHAGFHTMLGAEGYASVMNHIDARIADGDAVFMKAREIAEQRANRPEHIREETLAYLVEAAPELPFIRRILAQVRQWLYRQTGGRFVNLNADDMAAMVSASLRVYAKQAEAEAKGWMPMYQRDGGVFVTDEIDDITGLPLNSDGTVTVYHHTSKINAESISKSGLLKAAAEPDVYVTTRKETDTGYGDTAVPVRVKPDQLEIDDEFPDGRIDYRINAKRPGGSVKVSVGEAAQQYSRESDLQQIREAANQPLGTAIDDNPDMRIPDEEGVVRSAVDIAADAADEIQRMNELSKGFEAAITCAFRFGT